VVRAVRADTSVVRAILKVSILVARHMRLKEFRGEITIETVQ
jgi:hypothetical protein